MFGFDVDYEFRAEATDGHGDEVGEADFAFDAAEEAEEGVIWQYVVEVFVGEEQDALLLLVDMVDLHEFDRHNDVFWMRMQLPPGSSSLAIFLSSPIFCTSILLMAQ